MGSPIPHSIKIKVIDEWMQGNSRDKIAQSNGIGKGTVSSIIQQAKSNNSDIDLLRDLAVKMKRESLDLNYFSSSVRLKKVLDRLEISEDKIEAFLEKVDIHCFKKNASQEEFVSNIDVVVSNLARELNISINDIPRYISQKTKQLTDLNKEIEIKQRQINQIIEEYGLTIQDLEQYRSNRPSR
jgi:hypothetical protein